LLADRFEKITALVDIVRIDHFRGFQSCWQVPAGEATAVNGQWVEAPGEAFFKSLEQRLGHLPIWAEDLGSITREVEELRDMFGFPGMKILQFAFDEKGAGNPYLPFNYTRNCVVYTGTHDNDTTAGWFEKLSCKQRRLVLYYVGGSGSRGIHWDMIRWAMGSVADSVIIPLQDLLGLGSEARMNNPGHGKGQWAWRYRAEALTDDLAERLGKMTELFGRTGREAA